MKEIEEFLRLEPGPEEININLAAANVCTFTSLKFGVVKRYLALALIDYDWLLNWIVL